MTRPTPAIRVFTATRDSSAESLGIEPGWFVRAWGCSIWFEVLSVHSTFVCCASRNPKHKSQLMHFGDHYSAIDLVCNGVPEGCRWIMGDRTKSFYDKFYPEVVKITGATSTV